MHVLTTRSIARWAAGLAGAVLLSTTAAGSSPSPGQGKHEFSISAYKYGYRVSGSNKPEMRVIRGDLIKITFSAEDIPHGFTLEAYRIMKRAEPGKPTTIEFRADKPGDFEFYCNLGNDERCVRETRGVLKVVEK